MEFLLDYGMFLLKTLTLVVAVLFIVGGIISLGSRSKRETPGRIEVTDLCERYRDYERRVQQAVLDEAGRKAAQKAEKREDKARCKGKAKGGGERRPRLYVLDFHGDIRASAVERLREEVSAVLTLAEASDEVILRLESGGGVVHGYGLAASQLQRIRDAGVPLTVAVDKVAASGGYMMACIGQRIIAAPFAVLGSIGVMAQLPNFHRLLKKHDIDIELHTAGEFKRTLTMLGENSDRARRKFLQELEETHQLFKQFVAENRPALEIEQVATGEIWYGRQALERGLVDALQTSDAYLMERRGEWDIHRIAYVEKHPWARRMALSMEGRIERWLSNLGVVMPQRW